MGHIFKLIHLVILKLGTSSQKDKYKEIPWSWGASDATYVVTGQSSTGRASSSVPIGIASADEVHLLKEKMEEQNQEAKAREDALRKEIEELRKRDEAREAEFRKREEAREAEFRETQEAWKSSQEATKKEMDDKLAAFQSLILYRVNHSLTPSTADKSSTQ